MRNTGNTWLTVRRAQRATLLLLSLAVAGLSPTHARAQAEDPGGAKPTAVAGEFPVRVTGSSVNLRSRADRNSVPVARVAQDSVLRAVAEEAGWFRLIPPDGVFSFVSADYVDQTAPGVGRIEAGASSLRVRTGSQVLDVDPLQTEVQALLESGATVQILGQQGGWLKIRPPDGVFVYIATQYAERVPVGAASSQGVTLLAPERASQGSAEIGSVLLRENPGVSGVPISGSASGGAAPAHGDGAGVASPAIPAPAADTRAAAGQQVSSVTGWTPGAAGIQPAAGIEPAAPAGTSSISGNSAISTPAPGAFAAPSAPQESGAGLSDPQLEARLDRVISQIQAEQARPVLDRSWRNVISELEALARQPGAPAVTQEASGLLSTVRQEDARQQAAALRLQTPMTATVRGSQQQITTYTLSNPAAIAGSLDQAVRPALTPAPPFNPPNAPLPLSGSTTLAAASQPLDPSAVTPGLVADAGIRLSSSVSTTDGNLGFGSSATSRPAAATISIPSRIDATLGDGGIYHAQGRLEPAFELPAGQFGLRYRLTNPLTRKLVGYVEFPYDLNVNVSVALDRFVGVWGPQYMDTVANANIIRATQLTIVGRSAPAAFTNPQVGPVRVR